MKYRSILLYALSAILSGNLFSQNIAFIKDSVMDEYMRSGYSNKHFLPEGSTKNGVKTGKWKDYEVSLDFEYLTIEDKPQRVFGYYLL